jgi:hypothetical protein
MYSQSLTTLRIYLSNFRGGWQPLRTLIATFIGIMPQENPCKWRVLAYQDSTLTRLTVIVDIIK